MEGCGIIGERHHKDYNKPLDIIWLCKKHHLELHRKEPRYCIVKGCKSLHRAKGYCYKHYYTEIEKPLMFDKRGTFTFPSTDKRRNLI